MGNTVTKESSHCSQNIRSTHQNLEGAILQSLNGNHSSQLSETRCTSPHRPSRNRHHHQHNSKHSRAIPQGYEMIIDPNETVDGGYLFPQGVYQGSQDFKVSVVRDMIISRRLAPFYKGLDSVEPGWTDEELLENVKCDIEPSESPKAGLPGPPTKSQQIWLYRNVHECPICFLVYPRLNNTRCCSQEICTECFVQIKRNPPHPPNTSNQSTEATDVLDLLSEPAACPYCAQPDLGVVFEAPPFEWGFPSSSSPSQSSSPSSFRNPQVAELKLPTNSERKIRTINPTSDTAVTIDMIRPDWEEKLASARRRLARKSAAARALHRSALLPRDRSETGILDFRSDLVSRNRSQFSYDEAMRTTRSMTSAQTRALEQKMIDEAIKASLTQL